MVNQQAEAFDTDLCPPKHPISTIGVPTNATMAVSCRKFEVVSCLGLMYFGDSDLNGDHRHNLIYC